MEHLSATKHPLTLSAPQSHTRHAVFKYFFCDYSKQNASTTAAHRKHTIGLLNKRQIMSLELSNILENKYVCAEHYRCSMELYLLSMLSKAYNIIIDHGVSVTGHEKG